MRAGQTADLKEKVVMDDYSFEKVPEEKRKYGMV